MFTRTAVTMALCACLSLPVPPALSAQGVDPALVTALREATRDRGMFTTDLDALVWLAEMAERLRYPVPDPFYRVRLLKLVHSESVQQGLDPQVVLALIQVESGFRRHAVSRSGARGLMQVMPFWIDVVGEPGDDLFNPVVNIRYGCRILRHYLDLSGGDLDQALSAYNGSSGKPGYPARINAALAENWQYTDPSLPSTAALLSPAVSTPVVPYLAR